MVKLLKSKMKLSIIAREKASSCKIILLWTQDSKRGPIEIQSSNHSEMTIPKLQKLCTLIIMLILIHL